MHKKHFSRLLLIAAACVMMRTEFTVADFRELLQHVPSDANTLVVIDVEKIMSSPLARKENWKDKYASAYVDMPLFLPPDASRLVMAASIDLSSWVPSWEAAAMDLTDSPSVADIAKSEKGHLDSLAGAKAAWTPFDAYFIELTPKMLGVVHPAKRQFAARWIESGRHSGHSTLSQFLHVSVEPSKLGDIMMAIDMEHCMSAVQLHQELEQMKAVQGQGIDFAALGKLLSGIKGVTFHVHIKDKLSGDIAFHFGHDVSTIKPFAKPLLIESLNRAGASFNDMQNWHLDISPKGTIVSLKGEISRKGLRRLLSVIELPIPHKHGKGGSAESPAEATRKHFQAVTTLLTELEQKEGDDTMGHQDMIWYQRYSRKIDRLPLLNVDPDVQSYSGQVASLLMQAASALESTRQAARAQSAAYHPGATTWGYWGTANRPGGNSLAVGGSVNYDRRQHWSLDQAQEANRQNILGQQKQVQAQQMAAGTDAARQILQQVQDLTAQVRAKMTDRYKINF